jgi:hypothetical protein
MEQHLVLQRADTYALNRLFQQSVTAGQGVLISHGTQRSRLPRDWRRSPNPRTPQYTVAS